MNIQEFILVLNPESNTLGSWNNCIEVSYRYYIEKKNYTEEDRSNYVVGKMPFLIFLVLAQYLFE